jgi:ribosome-binding protein aMBF1 (putative translation factor)
MVDKRDQIKTYDEFVSIAKKKEPEKWDEIQFHADLISKIVIERTKRGLTQEKLAELTGLKQSAIARIESCKCIPKVTTLQKIMNQIGLGALLE